MPKINAFIGVSMFSLVLLLFISSCTKETGSVGTKYKEDPNNYFIANFNGKTLKTNGFIYTINGVADDVSGSLALSNAIISTSNINGAVKTDLVCSVQGSILNMTYISLYQIPTQQLDATFMLEKTGNAVGAYKVLSFGSTTYYTSSITDLTVGKKKYDLDPISTTINVTSADLLWIQGNFSGNLIDGSIKIPVTGSFKLRKL